MSWSIDNRVAREVVIHEPIDGRWIARVSIEGLGTLGARATLRSENGPVEFVGAVSWQSQDMGYTETLLVGGVGKLSQTITAKGYKNTSVLNVARDIIASCGEELDAASSAPASLPFWMVPAIQAHAALTEVCNASGLVWRVGRNGKVLIGAPTYKATASAGIVVSTDAPNRRTVIATLSADVLPGDIVDGNKVGRVDYEFSAETGVAHAYHGTP